MVFKGYLIVAILLIRFGDTNVSYLKRINNLECTGNPPSPPNMYVCKCTASSYIKDQYLYQYYDSNGRKNPWANEIWIRTGPLPWNEKVKAWDNVGVGSFNQGEDSDAIPGPFDQNDYAILEFQEYSFQCDWEPITPN